MWFSFQTSYRCSLYGWNTHFYSTRSSSCHICSVNGRFVIEIHVKYTHSYWNFYLDKAPFCLFRKFVIFEQISSGRNMFLTDYCIFYSSHPKIAIGIIFSYNCGVHVNLYITSISPLDIGYVIPGQILCPPRLTRYKRITQHFFCLCWNLNSSFPGPFYLH